MWCTLKLSSGVKLLLGCIYRSPNFDDENDAKLNELVCKADLFPAKYKCIVGDFNFPSINWSLGNCKDPKSLAFINTTLNCFLTQNVSNPTRHRDGQQSNLLDLIFTNDENLMKQVSHNPPLGKSDHDMLLFDLEINITNVPTKEYLNYYRADYNVMRQEMADVNWAYLDGCSIDESWQFIKCNIHQCAQKNIPKYTILNSQRSPIWMTKKAIEAVRAKARAYKTYRKTNSHVHAFKFKRLRNVATAEVKK